ncbi:MAG: NADH:flavin oxidoreductase [Alphaproteobacteria bacterium]|nr:MAG: NADH:flavin oxidoreductase [Alphaproteobacteria bacterium]
MARNPRYDVLFEPVRIGPVTAKNRFYQVPHCSGMGFMLPQMLAAMREVKAEGGWGVVCTEYCSIHPTADDSPFPYASLWDEDDVRCQALMADKVHAHGALAGVELWHGGNHATNRTSRLPSISPSGHLLHAVYPAQTRAMDKTDIRNLRRWQVDAAKRAKRAGFDIVYVYAGHAYLPFQFIARRLNHRTDEYGGSLENRVRLLRELIEDTKEAVGDTCAVAVRFAVDELIGDHGVTSDGEGREVVEMLAELPDLWDVNLSYVENDSWSARFSEEGYQERFVSFVKTVTTKPVVGVGRFTSPDTMVSQIRRGILDLIGAARPSIADPFLPRKIEEGREDEIRECIGCNMCRAANNENVPIRCTQNPTMGEEWRRGWHPERVPAKGSDGRVLVVGAGPAGLECAMTLGKRGYAVALAEATTSLGGRVGRECLLPGLSSWARVRDYRVGQIEKLHNVEVYLDSRLSAEQVLEFGFDHVILATGARWRRDGIGYFNEAPVPGADRAGIFTPDDILAGGRPEGPVVIYDDEHHYMGGALAELLAREGRQVTLVTPSVEVSSWTKMTDEQGRVQRKLLELGVTIVLTRRLVRMAEGGIEVACIYTGRLERIDCDSLLLLGARMPDDRLYHEIAADPAAVERAGIRSVTRIGDCYAPGAIIHAVYSGHRIARELDAAPAGEVPYRRERLVVP